MSAPTTSAGSHESLGDRAPSTDPRVEEVERERLGPTSRVSHADFVAREEPLEIQVQGASVAVLMRTPGDDLDLARGFLRTEGIIRGVDDIASMRHCSSVKDPESEENILRVVLSPGIELAPSVVRGRGYASSSCGLCGKATIEATLVDSPPLALESIVTARTLFAMPETLRRNQPAFDATGGLHAAGIFTLTGELVVLREDVGRHNAVDKAIGAVLERRLDPRALCLFVSGRTSFEIVQKAAVARIPIVAGVSAVTSLAVSLAERARVTLVGFVRCESASVYAWGERIG